MDITAQSHYASRFAGNSRERAAGEERSREQFIKIQNGITLSVLFPEIIKTTARYSRPVAGSSSHGDRQTYANMHDVGRQLSFPFGEHYRWMVNAKVKADVYIMPPGPPSNAPWFRISIMVLLSSGGMGKRKIYDSPVLDSAREKFYLPFQEISITDPQPRTVSIRTWKYTDRPRAQPRSPYNPLQKPRVPSP